MGEKELLEENKKLRLENAKLLKSNAELRRERDRLHNLMYDIINKLHGYGFTGK